MGISELLATLGDNPYFGAGFGLIGIGTGIAMLKKSSQMGMIMFRRHYMTTLEVPSRDKSYYWLLEWLGARGMYTQHLSVETTFRQTDAGKVNTSFDFVPSPGKHFFVYQGTWVQVERTREKQMMDLQTGVPWEVVTMTAIGRNRQVYFK